MGFLIPPHPLTNFEIQKYYKNEPRFNGVFSRNNLPEYNSIKKIKDGALFCKKNEIIYFDSFDFEYIPKEIKEFIRNKNIKTNIFWIQENNSIMCGYFCIRFIDFMLAGKKVTDYKNLFSPHDLKKER